MNQPTAVVQEKAAWLPGDLKRDTSWIYRLTGTQNSRLQVMADNLLARCRGDLNSLMGMQPDSFDLGEFAPVLEDIRNQLRNGYGLALIRGLPVDDLTPEQLVTIYWGIGRHLGRAVSNNPQGDMIGHVVDAGKDYRNPNHRGYQTNAAMDFHCDQCDLVGLLCIQTAKSGGTSKVVSSLSVYNNLLEHRPDLVEVLSQPFCWSKHGEQAPGELGYYESPVFNWLNGKLCVALGPMHMRKGHALPEAPDLTDIQKEAIAEAEKTCEKLHYAMELERGDIQLLNNSVTLHTRTAFEDWPNSNLRRRLWRLWLVAEDMRPPTPYIAQWRHGVHLKGADLKIDLRSDAEAGH